MDNYRQRRIIQSNFDIISNCDKNKVSCARVIRVSPVRKIGLVFSKDARASYPGVLTIYHPVGKFPVNGNEFSTRIERGKRVVNLQQWSERKLEQLRQSPAKSKLCCFVDAPALHKMAKW